MAMLTGEWLDAMQEEFHQPYYKELYQFVKDEYSSTQVFPPADDIFNAMHFTPLDKVKVQPHSQISFLHHTSLETFFPRLPLLFMEADFPSNIS